MAGGISHFFLNAETSRKFQERGCLTESPQTDIPLLGKSPKPCGAQAALAKGLVRRLGSAMAGLSRVPCPICTPAGPADRLAELPTTWVTGSIAAPLPGYACVVAKRHVVEPFELEGSEQLGFWDDCMRTARALVRLYKPRKMNYEIHGNTVPHLHMHLYPRYAGDPYEGRPIGNEARFQRTPEELALIGRAVSASDGASNAWSP
jgi:diadenosine tetraphosphate (Ap4A) HIT family hydrolase